MKESFHMALKYCLSNLLFETRKENRLSQEEMAYFLSISTRSYSDLENGKFCCSLNTFLRFLYVFCEEPYPILDHLIGLLDTADSDAV